MTMNKNYKRIRLKVIVFASIFIASLFYTNAFAANISDFNDVKGHWAESALERAVTEGILNGNKGMLLPNSKLKGAELATMVVRSLELQEWDKPYPGTNQSDWYYRYAAIAVHAGILPEDGSINLNEYVTRQQVFKVFSDICKFDKSLIDEKVIEDFTDADELQGEYREAAAFLVTEGIIKGDENKALRH